MAMIQAIDGILARIGRSTLAMFESIGRLVIFASLTVSHIVRPPFYYHAFLQQLINIGFYSLPVVGLTALFTGARWYPFCHGVPSSLSSSQASGSFDLACCLQNAIAASDK